MHVKKSTPSVKWKGQKFGYYCSERKKIVTSEAVLLTRDFGLSHLVPLCWKVFYILDLTLEKGNIKKKYVVDEKGNLEEVTWATEFDQAADYRIGNDLDFGPRVSTLALVFFFLDSAHGIIRVLVWTN